MINKKVVWALVFLVLAALIMAEECVCPRVEQPSIVLQGFTLILYLIVILIVAVGVFIALRVNKFNLGYKLEEAIGLPHGVIISGMLKDELVEEVSNRAVDRLDQQIIGGQLVPKGYYKNPRIIQGLEAKDYVKLLDYIKNYMQQGRKREEIRDWLLRQGIHPRLIEKAFSDIY